MTAGYSPKSSGLLFATMKGKDPCWTAYPREDPLAHSPTLSSCTSLPRDQNNREMDTHDAGGSGRQRDGRGGEGGGGSSGSEDDENTAVPRKEEETDWGDQVDTVQPIGERSEPKSEVLENQQDVLCSKSSYLNSETFLQRLAKKRLWKVEARYLIVVVYVYMVFVTGCLYWGWGRGIRDLLYRSKAYSWRCLPASPPSSPLPPPPPPNNNNPFHTCTAQEVAVNKLLPIALAAHLVVASVAGAFLDIFGPLYTALFGITIKTVGWILIATSSQSFEAYIPGALLFGGSTDCTYLPLLATACALFRKKGVITAIMGSAMSASAAIPVALYEVGGGDAGDGPSFQQLVYGYLGVGLGSFVLLSLFFLPRNKKDIQDADKRQQSFSPDDESSTNQQGATRVAFFGTTTSASAAGRQILAQKQSTICDLRSQAVPLSTTAGEEGHHRLKQESSLSDVMTHILVADVVETTVTDEEEDSSSSSVGSSDGAMQQQVEATPTMQDASKPPRVSRRISLELTYVTIEDSSCPARRPPLRQTLVSWYGCHIVEQAKDFLPYFRSPRYILIIPFAAIILLRVIFLSNSTLEQLGPTVDKLWGKMRPATFASCILLGVMSDIVGIIWTLLLINALGFVMFLFVLGGALPWKYLTVVVFFFFCSYCMTSLYTYLQATHPARHFGKLAGIASMVSGLIQFVGMVFYQVSKENFGGDFLPMNLSMVGLSVLNFAIWGYLFYLHRRHTRFTRRCMKDLHIETPKS